MGARGGLDTARPTHPFACSFAPLLLLLVLMRAELECARTKADGLSRSTITARDTFTIRAIGSAQKRIPASYRKERRTHSPRHRPLLRSVVCGDLLSSPMLEAACMPRCVSIYRDWEGVRC